MRYSGRSLARVVFRMALLLSISTAAASASVVWGTPVNIAADTDVMNTGTISDAWDFAWAAPIVVNGVSFSLFTQIVDTTFSLTSGNVTLTSASSIFNTPNNTSAGLSGSYTDLMSAADFSFGMLNVNIASIAPGHTFAVEIWAGGTNFGNSQSQIVYSGDQAVAALALNTGNSGQYVIGTFVDTGAATSFTLGAPGYLNAIEIADISSDLSTPEPPAILLAGIALAILAIKDYRSTAITS